MRDGGARGWASGKGAQRTQHGVQHLLGSTADQPARPGAAGGGASPSQPLPSPRLLGRPLRLRPSAPSAAQLPPPRPAVARARLRARPARPACPARPSSPPGRSGLADPLLLRPAVLTFFPPSLRGCPPSRSTSTRSRSRSASSRSCSGLLPSLPLPPVEVLRAKQKF